MASGWRHRASLWENGYHWSKCRVLSHVWLYVIPWTGAFKAPLSMEFSGKNTAVDCHFLFQGIFPIQELNPCLLCLLHRRWILYPLSHRGSPLVNNDNGCKLVTCVHTKSLQLCQPLCDPVDCGPPGSPVRGDSPGKNTGVGCLALPQGKFTGRIQVLKNHFQCIK